MTFVESDSRVLRSGENASPLCTEEGATSSLGNRGKRAVPSALRALNQPLLACSCLYPLRPPPLGQGLCELEPPATQPGHRMVETTDVHVPQSSVGTGLPMGPSGQSPSRF